MYFVCECGAKCRDLKTDARDHVAEKHKGLVDSEFGLMLGQPLFGQMTVPQTVKGSELWERALDSMTDDLMDALYDDE